MGDRKVITTNPRDARTAAKPGDNASNTFKNQKDGQQSLITEQEYNLRRFIDMVNQKHKDFDIVWGPEGERLAKKVEYGTSHEVERTIDEIVSSAVFPRKQHLDDSAKYDAQARVCERMNRRIKYILDDIATCSGEEKTKIYAKKKLEEVLRKERDRYEDLPVWERVQMLKLMREWRVY